MASLTFASACSGEPPLDEAATPATETNAGSAPDEGAELVYEEQFDNGTQLQIVRQGDDSLGTMVAGPIAGGSQALGVQASGATSLGELYAVLGGGKALPEALRSVETKYDSQLAAQWPSEGDLAAPAQRSVHEKSQSGFENTLCKTLHHDGHTFYNESCKFKHSTDDVCTAYVYNTSNRAYGWNENDYVAYFTMSASSWTPTLPEYWWAWVEYGGTFSGKRVCLNAPELYVPIGWIQLFGDMGVTSHWR